MNDEKLHCTCGREVRIVRLNSKLLTLGHTTNPTYQSHPVRLARSGDQGQTVASRCVQRHPAPRSEGPATRREDAPNAGPSNPRTTSGTRAKSNGSSRTAAPSGTSNPRPVRARRVDRVVIPPDRPSASRPERLGLRSTPGEQA